MKKEEKATESIKVQKIPASLVVNEDDLPDIRNWKVGKEYSVKVRMKQVSATIDPQMMTEGNPKKMNARFHILSIEAIKEGPVSRSSRHDRLKEKTQEEY